MFPLFTLEWFAAFVFGAVIGSFANVCIHRLPGHQSLVFPASHCPHCQRALRPWHNIPLLSYLWLRGRCAYCQVGISWRYPLVECLCGLLYGFLYSQFGLSAHSLILTVFTTALLIVSFIDLAHKIVPDVITLPGILAGLIVSLFLTPVGIINAFLGLVLGGGLFLLIAVLSRGGMGGGDIKLVAMIGAFLGWQAVLLTIFLAASLGAVIGIGLILLKQKGRKDPLPFGPFLALGAFIAMVWGPDLIFWYRHIAS
jgi:leader peptidase (prepilin peptidase)/N-methyltransferase